MDLRRPTRSSSSGVEPMFRQVGFVTTSAAAAMPPPAADLAPGSLSPVMIPPPRVPDHLVPPPPASESGSLVPSSPPPPSSSRLDAASDLEDDDDVDVCWARPPPTAPLESVEGDLTETQFEGVPTPIRQEPSCAAKTALKEGPEAESVKGDLTETHDEGRPAEIPQKTKTSKAERRAIQEAQRAAKAASKEAGLSGKSVTMASRVTPAMSKQPKTVKPSPKKDMPQGTPIVASDKKIGERPLDRDRKKDGPHPRMQFDDVHWVEKSKRRSVVNQPDAQNRVELFRHLPQYEHGTQLPDLELKKFQLDPMHPSVYKVGLQYLSGNISGGNARCVAMLLAFREAIKDYSTPAAKTLSRDLTAKISSYVSFLTECRPLSISMGNAIRFLKNKIAKLPHTLSESEAKASLQFDIDRFINEKIVVADRVIVSHAITKVRNDDVLLTYGSPSVVEMLFYHANELGRRFRVVVVDSHPSLEGQGLLRRLLAKGISCTYTHINAVSYIMHEVTRVILGASSVLSNGAVFSRVGTASVAMVAHARKVPVLVCCEAYKFHERVQLDSICSNELGDPDAISRFHERKDLSHFKKCSDNDNLQFLNLKYDITPSEYVSMIITDYGMLPPTSVPAIVREYRREHIWI